MRLALRGPALAGKTTLANYLGKKHGFTVVRYNDILKVKAAQALTKVGRKTTLNDIRRDKEVYRPFLQELGSLLKFDEGAFIEEALFAVRDKEHVVFDNVRFLPQWEKLQRWGFALVKLELRPDKQLDRAMDNGLPVSLLGRAMKHPAELGFPQQQGELVLDATQTPKQLADNLLVWLSWYAAWAQGDQFPPFMEFVAKAEGAA